MHNMHTHYINTIYLMIFTDVPELNATIETYTDREGCKNVSVFVCFRRI